MSYHNDLSEFGFEKNCIAETIISTYTDDREPTAAPMGVITEDLRTIILKIYRKSQTYKNLIFYKCGVINITQDPELFYRTLFKETNPNGIIPRNWFIHAENVDSPRLRNIDVCLEFRITNVEELEDKALFTCRIEKINLVKVPFIRVYSRVYPAVIESLIHTSKLEYYLSKDFKKAEELIRLIKHYSELVNRIAPNSSYSEIMKYVHTKIDKMRRS